MHFFSICHLYVIVQIRSNFKTSMYRLIIDIIEIFNTYARYPVPELTHLLRVMKFLFLYDVSYSCIFVIEISNQ